MGPDPSFHRRAAALFADALDQADPEAFLDGACDDDALRAEVRELLDAHATAGDALTPPEAGGLADALVGRGVGPWQVDAVLGEGGMGAVYRAHRVDGAYRREVALKMLQPGVPGAAVLRRFLAERDVLARLEHPGIARLYDAGVDAEGRPFLAMELVPGAQITAWAETASVEDRLDVFVQVCDAVAFAHQNLVVHRDLKPSNLLVTEGGGRPRAVVLDFGIAKLLDAPDAETTRTGAGPLTPAYAAPEQVRGESVTTATDVYALGVVLYELLSGRRPYDVTGASPTELERTLMTQPARPSAVVAERAHARRLRGDLDTVVLKAMAAEPERRYPTASALADDLRRHLAGEPVAARLPTTRYRVTRFVRRHRVGVGVAAAAVALLAVVVAAYTLRLRAERDRAEARFAIAREAARAMIYDVHDAVAGLPGATPARAVLVDRAQAYLDELSAQAADDPALRIDLAGAYRRVGDVEGSPISNNLGRTADARASYLRGLGLIRGLPPDLPDSLAAAAASTEGQLWKGLGVVVAHTATPDSALAHLRRAIDAYARAVRLAPDDLDHRVDLAAGHVNLGDYLGHPYFPNAERPDAALVQYARARALIESVPEPERSLYALRIDGITYEREGNLHRSRGDLDAAVAPLRRSNELRQLIAARPDADADAIRDAGIGTEALGLLAIERGRFGEAERSLLAAQTVYQRLADADPKSANARQTLAFGHLNLARLYGDPDGPDLGRPAEARRHAAEGARIFRALAEADPDNDRLQSLADDAETTRDRIR
ncbi:serine/threonine-protein kinase [Rubrivirga marina]|uniref:Protein kinase domain-containing protein n=1 Tax=Rubrivirga marina TaxID=1196024 RepID=A0A271J4R7_9BACT|nr:serine/threonine-protein kinase [Rubrivirga marina]PAP78516.1 hypothetical protein BSZ37_19840 [Rubrivirga marina]